MKQHPNIVLCICDQLRPFEIGCYGNRVIRTPHMDRLAAEGVRFEEAVSNNPVCMPARSCLLSGQYSRTCMGSLSNHVETDATGRATMPEYPVDRRAHLPDPTLAEMLKAAGYDTALIGKWHIHPTPKVLGFDYAVYPRVHHRHTGQHFLDNSGNEWPVEGYSVEYESALVGRYLRGHRERPFFLYYSISPPHMPLLDAPESYLRMYSPDEVALRPNTRVDGRLAWDENWFKIYLWDFLYYERHLPHTAALPEGFDLKRLTALYYGMTTWVDDMIGRLMEGLRENGLADDTVVVFVSDHGDHLGSHHRFNKGSLVEESIRIPLIFNAPGLLKPRVNRRQVAQIIDVAPTLLDLCGLPVSRAIQGRRLTPLLRGDREELAENRAFIETGDGQIGLRTPGRLCGIRMDTNTRKAEDRLCCLYDLANDPYELRNLAAEGGLDDEAAAAGRSLLREWRAQTPWMAGHEPARVS